MQGSLARKNFDILREKGVTNTPEVGDTFMRDPRIMVDRSVVWDIPNFDTAWISMSMAYQGVGDRG